MKICLFGATGLLGSNFKKIFKKEKLNFIAPTRGEVQLLSFNKTLEYLKKEKPDLIVNCAAFTDVDGAERNPESCFDLNVDALRNLTKSGIPLINFSTEYVFNAPLRIEIPEDYPKNPQGAYSKSKAQGEKVLEHSDIDWWNIRTTWLFGSGGKNFVDTILKLSKTHNELEIINDQFGRPTYAGDLAEFVTQHFISPGLKFESFNKARALLPKPGHYHLQNSGEVVSWAEFAEYFLHKSPDFDIRDKKIKSGLKCKIIPVTTKEYGALALRPKNSVLKNTKLEDNLRNWKKSIQDYLNL